MEGKFLTLRNLTAAAVTAFLMTGIATGAHADLVTFDAPPPACQGGQCTTFADGYFSQNLSAPYYGQGQLLDGFYQNGDIYSAYNGFSWTGEYIAFNQPVTLNSLQLYGPSFGVQANQVQVILENSSKGVITSQLLNLTSSAQTLNFSTPGVAYVVFDVISSVTDPASGLMLGTYVVSQVNYDDGSLDLPEPATWLMMLIGFGLMSVQLRRSGFAQA